MPYRQRPKTEKEMLREIFRRLDDLERIPVFPVERRDNQIWYVDPTTGEEFILNPVSRVGDEVYYTDPNDGTQILLAPECPCGDETSPEGIVIVDALSPLFAYAEMDYNSSAGGPYSTFGTRFGEDLTLCGTWDLRSDPGTWSVLQLGGVGSFGAASPHQVGAFQTPSGWLVTPEPLALYENLALGGGYVTLMSVIGQMDGQSQYDPTPPNDPIGFPVTFSPSVDSFVANWFGGATPNAVTASTATGIHSHSTALNGAAFPTVTFPGDGEFLIVYAAALEPRDGTNQGATGANLLIPGSSLTIDGSLTTDGWTGESEVSDLGGFMYWWEIATGTTGATSPVRSFALGTSTQQYALTTVLVESGPPGT